MVKTLIKLSVLAMFAIFAKNLKADSFFLPNSSSVKEIEKTNTPLVYIEDMQYFNRHATSSYTNKISEMLSFEPEIVVTKTKEMADLILIPKLIRSKIEPIDNKNSRYSMSLVIELIKKDGTIIDKGQQNRYIIVKTTENTQEIAHKLLTKLLEDALNALSYKIKSAKPE